MDTYTHNDFADSAKVCFPEWIKFPPDLSCQIFNYEQLPYGGYLISYTVRVTSIDFVII